MSERESGLDICPECKVRDGDSSEKKLFQCQYCERWFCERHLEPRLAVIRDFNKIIKDKEWRTMVEEDWKREDGHPDYAYTKEKFDELKIEREIVWAKINAFLDKSRVYKKPVPKGQKEEFTLLFKEHLVACPKCGSTRTMITAYRKEFEAFECLSCHHKWKEKRGIVKEEGSYRLFPIQPKSHKVRNVILVISLLAVLLISLALFSGLPNFNIRTPNGTLSGHVNPVASFYSSKTTDIFIGEKIIFYASSSYDPDNSQGKGIITYRWDFGDGTPIENVSSYTVTHSYSLVKNYSVSLTVIDDDGQNATHTRTIEISWEVPTVSQLKSWLTLDKTNEMTYHDPDFVCFDFAKMLANHSRQKNWKMALVLIYGNDTTTNLQWDHAVDTINTTEGLVYIESQTDEVWWCNNHAQMVVGNTYSFWSYPYLTVHVYIREILVLHLEDLDKYDFIRPSLLPH